MRHSLPSRRVLFAALAPFASVAGLAAQDPAQDRQAALQQATASAQQAAAPTPTPAGAAAPVSGPLRLLDVSMIVLGAAGASTERNDVLADLQAGGHDPKRRGFTLQQAELSLTGAVDPYLQGHVYLVALLDPDEGETVVELEEAYLTTQQLPYGLEVKAGTFLTEFGRINGQHPHSWDWLDQPVIHSRVFGADGMRGPGARLGWRVPRLGVTDLLVGIHNGNGETMTSFLANDEVYEERGIGGRAFTETDVRSGGDFVYTGRVATAFDQGDHTLGLGASVAFGPNATGADGETLLWGLDAAWKWSLDAAAPHCFLKVQAEWLARAFDAAEQDDNGTPVPAATLDDAGGFVQALYGLAPGWAVGVRAETAVGSGDSYDSGGQTFGRDFDPYRADRLRVSPLLAWKPTEYSRFRLQYSYDDSDHLEDEVHTVWLGFEFLLGSHPPHAY